MHKVLIYSGSSMPEDKNFKIFQIFTELLGPIISCISSTLLINIINIRNPS